MGDTREKAFMDDLQALVNKHDVEIEVTDDGQPYGMHQGVCRISFNYREGSPYHEFNLPACMYPQSEGE